MTPTPELRFVEREIQEPYEFELYKNITITKRVRILQQWWEKKIWAHDDWVVADGEWRDVPLEKEQA